MDYSDSCIVRHFDYYCALSPKDKKILAALEENPVEIARGTSLWQEGEDADEFYTLSQGWAYSYRYLENGARQILEVYLPGEILGLQEFAFTERLEGLAMIEDGIICPFPHQRMLELFNESLTLTAVMFAIASRQQALLSERLVSISRRSARQRLAHFLHEIFLRQRQTDPRGGSKMRLPLTQEQLGDLLGMSPVHVSRTFSVLNEAKLAYRNRHHVTIPDLKALAKEGGFDERYLDSDLTCFLRKNPPIPPLAQALER
ncbi:helix-turn-helix domain-containing protein [Halomonas sp. ZH2S]|uniref:Helix-turn-helix domain-containing protein n=1 Tax=Vreelandella zhuhanensis TaxID=2684210 RepID=A0A7X3H386_9GAMM|nr:Crp/Fnr family transcriptional regulator [Halomonas zhuhanensis]MWJ28838.1 helix-turn-helix domain-containing protein [Halomonas zhuhanensis]